MVLCDAPQSRGGSWGDDNNIIAALKVTDCLFRVSSDGGKPQPVTKLNQEQKEITHRWPQVLPGAHALLFTAHSSTGNYEEATIEALWLRTGESKTLVRGGYYGRYVPNGGCNQK